MPAKYRYPRRLSNPRSVKLVQEHHHTEAGKGINEGCRQPHRRNHASGNAEDIADQTEHQKKRHQDHPGKREKCCILEVHSQSRSTLSATHSRWPPARSSGLRRAMRRYAMFRDLARQATQPTSVIGPWGLTARGHVTVSGRNDGAEPKRSRPRTA